MRSARKGAHRGNHQRARKVVMGKSGGAAAGIVNRDQKNKIRGEGKREIARKEPCLLSTTEKKAPCGGREGKRWGDARKERKKKRKSPRKGTIIMQPGGKRR